MFIRDHITNQIETYYEYGFKINRMTNLKIKNKKIPTLKKDGEKRQRIQYIYLYLYKQRNKEFNELN